MLFYIIILLTFILQYLIMKNYVNNCVDQTSNKTVKNINDIFKKYMRKNNRKEMVETVREEQIDSVQEP